MKFLRWYEILEMNRNSPRVIMYLITSNHSRHILSSAEAMDLMSRCKLRLWVEVDGPMRSINFEVIK